MAKELKTMLKGLLIFISMLMGFYLTGYIKSKVYEVGAPLIVEGFLVWTVITIAVGMIVIISGWLGFMYEELVENKNSKNKDV